MESDLVSVLKTVCPLVRPDVAEPGDAPPYITFQHIGGTPWRYTDNAAADRRHSLIQVNAWATTRTAALSMIRSVEEALCAAGAFTARPASEPIGDVDEGTGRRGCIQDFDIWSSR